MSTPLISCRELAVYHQHNRLLYLDYGCFAQGKLTSVIGPNGAGKTTLLKALSGNDAAANRNVYYQDRPLACLSAREIAQKRAVLSQHGHLAFPLKVKELVQLGREPYSQSEFAKNNENVTAWAMEAMSLTHLHHRSTAELSGGELRRAHIARVLAQLMPYPQASLHDKWLLLDEPTNHLDIHHQYHLFDLLQQLKQQGLTIIAVLHDPALAINQSDHILMLKNGEKFAEQSATAVAQSGLLDALYQMNMGCRYCDYSGQYYLAPSLLTCSRGVITK